MVGKATARKAKADAARCLLYCCTSDVNFRVVRLVMRDSGAGRRRRCGGVVAFQQQQRARLSSGET